MEFINFWAKEEGNNELVFSDDKISESAAMKDFIDHSEQTGENVSFYRQFVNQVRNPEESIFDESVNEEFLDRRGQQPELFSIEDRENVVYDDFVGYEKLIAKFKKSLSFFNGFDKSFF